MFLLAQESSGALTRVLIWSLALIVVVIIGFVIVSWIRNRVTGTDTGPVAGFTLSDLRRLHKSGQMTDEEFERAKAKIIAVSQPTKKETAPSQGDTSGPAA